MQVSAQVNDTIACYKRPELVKIAHILSRAKECDTLLKLTNLQLSTKDSIIHIKDSIIFNSSREYVLCDSINGIYKNRISDLKDELKKNKTIFSGIGLILVILLLLK
jgi:septum formation inhibitor-activating ATPase MinD